jgi:hypothetical protein
MPFGRLLAVSAMALILPACSQSDSTKQDQMRIAASWTATTVLMLEAWLSGAVPFHYAQRTSQKVRKNLSELNSDATIVQLETQQVTETLRQTERGMETSDRGGVESSKNALAAAASKFREQSSKHRQ